MKSLASLGSVLLVLSAATGACFDDVPVGTLGDGGTPTQDGGSGASCASDSDCGVGEACAYESSLACTATGQCVVEAQTACDAYSAGCACDGTEINIACTPYPTGFVSKPLAHDGPCGSMVDGGTGSGACTEDSDCAAGKGCAYASADACTATGQCVAEAEGTCEAYEAGCACDGTVINIACTPYPEGFVSKPLAHAGTCATDGGSGSGDAGGGGACASDSDCGANEACAYLEANACSATGQCVTESQTMCASYEAGCACDGTVINIACTPYPEGYVSKPLAHAGTCAADGGESVDGGAPGEGVDSGH